MGTITPYSLKNRSLKTALAAGMVKHVPLITSPITSIKWINLRNKKTLEKFLQCRTIPLIEANKHAQLSRDMNIFSRSVKKKKYDKHKSQEGSTFWGRNKGIQLEKRTWYRGRGASSAMGILYFLVGVAGTSVFTLSHTYSLIMCAFHEFF